MDIDTWEQLKVDADNCKKCLLYKGRTQAVLGDGNKHALLMLVGEAPGKDEDIEGIPFTGKAGKLLDKALLTNGITRDHIYLSNVIKCRPWEYGPTGMQRNRTPQQDEIDECNSLLVRQIKLVNPLLILCVGAPAARSIIKSDFKITLERGLVFNSRFNIPAVATIHPAYVLRQVGNEYTRNYQFLLDDIETARKKTKELNLKSTGAQVCGSL